MNLYELRKQHKVSREKLAVDMGVTYSTIANFETGRTVPRVDMARKIAAYFDVPESDIEWGVKPDITDDDTEGKDLAAEVA